MRVPSCKSYCPSICSSKSCSIYSPCPIKLEDTKHVSLSPPPTTHVLEPKLCDEKTAVVSECYDGKDEVQLKSSLKKSSESGSPKVVRGRVKWLDYVGKELVEIREIEDMESVDSDGNDNPACMCVIQ